MAKQLIGFREAGNRMGVSADTVKGYVDDGELSYVNVGRGKKKKRRKIDPDDLDTFIEQRKHKGTQCISIGTAGSTTRKSGTRAGNLFDLQDARLVERQRLLLERSKNL
jgi:excisionase family DNA binding protein